MPKSYYENQGPTLLETALQTGARALTTQMVGSFFDKVPDEMRFAVSQNMSQINAISRGETDAINEMQILSKAIAKLPDVARIDALDGNDQPSSLLSQYSTIEGGLTKLMNDDNILYYDISEIGADGNPVKVKGTSAAIKKQASLILDNLRSNKPSYDLINATHQGIKELRGDLSTIRKQVQGGDFEGDKDELNKIVDQIDDVHSKNIYINGSRVFETKSFDKMSESLIDWSRLKTSARLTDWDFKTPGIQANKEFINDPKNTIDISGTASDFRDGVIKDLIENRWLKPLDGGTKITYKAAFALANKYAQDGRPKMSLALLDRIMPSGEVLDQKIQIEKFMRANDSYDFQKTSELNTIANKKITDMKGQVEFEQKQAVQRANNIVVNAKPRNNKLFNDIKDTTGQGWGFRGGEEEEMKYFSLKGTNNYKVPDDLTDFSNLAVEYANHFAQDMKFSSTVSSPDIIAAAQARKKQGESAKSLLKLIIYSSPNDLKGKIYDANGVVPGTKTPKIWTMENIDDMDVTTAYKTLKESQSPGGLLWVLGLNANNVDLPDGKRAALVNTRSKSLVTTGNRGWGDDNSAFTESIALQGKDGRLVVNMANHWLSNEIDLDAIASPEQLIEWKVKSAEIDFVSKVISGQYSMRNLTDPQRAVIKVYEDALEVSQGKASIKTITGSNGVPVEIVTPKVGDYSDKELTKIAADMKAQELAKFDARQDQSVVNQISSDNYFASQNQNDVNPEINTALDNLDYSADSGTLEQIPIDNSPIFKSLEKVAGVSVVPADEVDQSLKNLELQSVVLEKRERMEFKSTKKGAGRFGNKMTSLERGQFNKDGVVPKRLLGAYHKDKALSYGNDLTKDLKEITKLKNDLVGFESRVDDQLKNQGKSSFTEKTMQSARRNVRTASMKIKTLEDDIRSSLGDSISPTTGLLSDESTNMVIYDLLARAFPGKSQEELQQMMMRYSTSETEGYALN